MSALREKPLEARIWEAVGGWRQLEGDIFGLGWSVEALDFSAAKTVDWARSFHPDSLEICVNFAGHGLVRAGKQSTLFLPGCFGFYALRRDGLEATRSGGESNRFLTFEWSRSCLAKELEGLEDNLMAAVRKWLAGQCQDPLVGRSRPLPGYWGHAWNHWVSPDLPGRARSLWFWGRALELAGAVLFEDSPPRSEQRRRWNGRRWTERAQEYLRAHLAEPLCLKSLAREVGCSPFYLSRIFSDHVGETLPAYLRRLRIEKAAQLLRDGDHNVTEAAMAVGYSSLSHFSKAFCRIMGCCPCVYPNPARLVR
ncbi:Regulatory protein PchR [Methylacidimicrobium cyclopophantes]|uniref:Regulatory protein PchR n=2 Tax=Methylacidimicrobium cyclopophantes TaxID=1041766 RepID=A0A5E6MDB9_9BACT|nr:Regulatory protein PchR [Methylacidimicrobium cyclopophantes]